MAHPAWLEWFGYIASVVVAVSLMMSSLLKLRWYNLLGAALFSAYGFLIHAYPVGVLNGFIACADVYYLIRMYSAKEQFRVISVPPQSEYLACFFEEYRAEIAHYFPDFDFRLDSQRISFYVLRNLVPACLFVGTPREGGVLEVDLDFVVPAYRDFKPGEFLFGQNRALFQRLGIRSLVARSHEPMHGQYLRRMGFEAIGREGDSTVFVRDLGAGLA
jgi:hypothetical protein